MTNGPDLFVYLQGHAAPRSGGELPPDVDFAVALLRRIVCDQNHELPAEVGLPQFRPVVNRCTRFTTVCSTATLGAGREKVGKAAGQAATIGVNSAAFGEDGRRKTSRAERIEQ